MDVADDSIQSRLEFAIEIAREAGDITLDHFRQLDLQVEHKSDQSPVTAADRLAEELLRRRIVETYGGDGIVGEEFGSVLGSSGYQWILDPIDGTKSFIHGIPLYTTLIAVLYENQPQMGVIYAPALSEMVYAARGNGCWYIPWKNATRRSAWVSKVPRLEEGLLLTTEVASFTTHREPDALEVYLELQAQSRLVRTWGDGYGYLMVATGRADAMIDPAVNVWDAAPLQTIIEEAGGKFTDWQGEATIHSGDAIATNGLVTDQVLALTRGR